MHNLLNSLQSVLKLNQSFAFTRQPKQNQIAFWYENNLGNEHFEIQDFHQTIQHKIIGQPILIKASALENAEQIWQKFDLDFPQTSSKNHLSKKEYIPLINRCVHEIKQRNDLDKVVLSRTKMLDYNPKQILSIFLNLNKAYPNSFVYFWYKPKVGAWIGATPELLLSAKDKNIKSMSLAGTKTADRYFTPKEKEEQQMVSDYLEKVLRKYGKLQRIESNIRTHGKIQHLQSIFYAEMNLKNGLAQLLNDLHPTPAVCGLPKTNALSWILKNENYNREFYTGFLGLKQKNTHEFYVNLRCAQLFAKEVFLYVGGGITAKSIATEEWQETELKAQTIGRFIH